MRLGVTLDVLNQKGTPALYSDTFANRPTFGFKGRIFFSTDTGEIFEDTGSAWTILADAGAGTTGTLQQVTTNGNTTTLGVTIQGLTIGKGAGTIASNTAIGNLALNSNTTGFNNTALGLSSLLANTTGFDNTAIGKSALNANTTGTSNTAIGHASLTTNTTGIDNTSIGNSALSTNTTGNYNTAIGFNSLFSNTTGNSNTAIGINSLTLNTTGTLNTAIGYYALSGNTTGSNNTALGSSSLILNTTGTLNTAIGRNAGSLITTGSNNTILGNYAGTSTLASNIVLSDGAGNVRLFSDANGLIGINQAVGSVLGGQLDIHTTQTYALVLNGLTTNNAYTAFSNNSVGKWRIGNTYNAGANTFDIFNLGTSSNALSFNSTTNEFNFLTNGLINGLTIGKGTNSLATNLAFGYQALNGNISGIGNVGIGYQSLLLTTTGARNVGVGFGCLSANIDGSYNNAFGFNTLNANTSGTYNTAVGYYSLLRNTTGSNNTSFGGFCGQEITTGSINTLIGYNCGVTLSTGSNNTLIGSQINVGNVSNYIALADGTGAIKLAIPSTGNVLIGTTTDDTTNKLQVTGKAKITDIGTQLTLCYSAGVEASFRNDSGGGLLINTSSSYIINYIAGAERLRIKTNTINISSIPTSAVGLVSGDIYSNAGILTIVP